MHYVPKIDNRALADIEWNLLYGDPKTEACTELFEEWWRRKRFSEPYAVRGQDFWKLRWAEAVIDIKESLAGRNGNGRCVECGAKLTVRRCLACQVKRKMKTDDYQL